MPYRIDENAHFTRMTAGAIRVVDKAGLAGLTWQAVARESGGDPVAAALLCATTRHVEQAMAHRTDPLDSEVAEQVLRTLLEPAEVRGRHANLSPTTVA